MPTRSFLLHTALFYFGLLAADLFCLLIQQKSGHVLFKPTLMLWLIFLFYSHSPQPVSRIGQFILAALLFSWLGDVFLLGSAENYFLLGLVSFLVAHLFYIFAFRRVSTAETSILRRQPIWAVPLVLFLGGLLYLLRNSGDFFIPIVVYSLVLLGMVLGALNRFGRVSMDSFRWVFGGAVLFMVSDSIIAINRFLQPIAFADIVIMLLYATGQYAIVRGMLMQLKIED